MASSASPLVFDPLVAAALGVSAAVALFAPVVLALAVRRRTGASFKYFGFGAAIFFVFQMVLRVPWQVLLSLKIQTWAQTRPWLLMAWLAFSSLTAGLFEEVGRWLGYRLLIKDERSWRVGLMYGAGHGGIESILLVGASLAGSLVVYVMLAHGIMPGNIAPETLEVIRARFAELRPAVALLGGVERLFALAVQLALSLMVLQVFIRGERRWLVWAIACHTAVDLIAVTAAKYAGPFAAEGLLAGVAALAVVVIRRLRPSSG